jgi:hypothetical protein
MSEERDAVFTTDERSRGWGAKFRNQASPEPRDRPVTGRRTVGVLFEILVDCG